MRAKSLLEEKGYNVEDRVLKTRGEVGAFESVFPDQPKLTSALAEVVRQFSSPEHINESPDQSPSSRILQVIPDYVKPVAGILIAQKIGLATLRSKCTHFGDWIDRLEQLVSG